MDKNEFIGVILIFLFVSTTCNASLVFHLRKLIDNDRSNNSVTSQASPTGSPVGVLNANTTNSGESRQDKPKESQMSNQNNSSMTSPIDPKGSNENDTKTSGIPSPPVVEKNGNEVDKGNEKANVTSPNVGDGDSCNESMISCRHEEMLACIEASKDGSKKVFLVVKNEGEITLKVNVEVPNYLKNDLPAFEVPKHKSKRIDISSTVGKSTELTVNSGNAKCVLRFVQQSVSVDNLIQQLSFYSKQVTPIYVVYASFLLALLLGGTWACCRLRKRRQQDGIPYQELEMGIPESASAVTVDVAEGWDGDWGDDWDEEVAVKSPSGNHIRSVSADGLTSRSSKKDGWESDWED